VLLRLSLFFASLAWSGFVFTHTVGDPDRGEQVAEAVLADDDARAEVVQPITDAVMSSTGLPPDQQPFVASRVDQILLQPDGTRAFVDAFAGSWARMLGSDDPRGSRLDVRPFVDDIVASVPGLDPSLIPTEAQLPAAVPVPGTGSSWLGDLRRVVNALVLPLAVVAAVGMATAWAIGDRRRTGRRIGIWAVLAGGTWIAVPFLAVAAAQRWATGADDVIRVALDEGLSGLRLTAIALAAIGLATFVMSLPRFGADGRARESDFDHDAPRVDRRPVRADSGAGRRPLPPAPAPMRRGPRSQPLARPERVAPTMTMPVQSTDDDQRPPRGRDPDPDSDALWDYYTEPD
jgi:hypothetical protein